MHEIYIYIYIYTYACICIHIYTHKARLQTPINCLKANHTRPLLLITYIHKTYTQDATPSYVHDIAHSLSRARALFP